MKAQLYSYLKSLFSEPGLFDEGVEAARNACVAGASLASALITAAAWYENPLTGTPALLDALDRLRSIPGHGSPSCAGFVGAFAPTPHRDTGDPEHSPGFGYIDEERADRVVRAGQNLIAQFPGAFRALEFFLEQRRQIVTRCGALNLTGLCALGFHGAGLTADEAERSFLVLRVEAALREAQHARALGLKGFPFFSELYRYQGPLPEARGFDLEQLMTRVGISLP
ncbi:MAG TPA: hypothetical protein VFQ61_29845 [Polyangiaceae bacterium]|nr:hypothetical protein [Polyangiaceae bacterium]